MNKFLAILIFFSALSCAPKAPKTDLRVSLGAISGSANFPGGLIITGENSIGDNFVKKVSANDELLIELPNGTWNFAVIGWDGTEYFEGSSYCAQQSNISLNGVEVSLNLTATKANCVNPIYGQDQNGTILANATDGLNTLTINSCMNIKQYLIDEGSQAAPADLDCSGSTPEMPLPGGIQSIKVLVPEVINGTANIANSIIGKCYNLSSSQVSTAVRLPFSSQFARFPVAILAFDGANCSGNQSSYQYPNGLNQIATEFKGGATPDASNSVTFVNLHSNACVGAQLSGSPYAISAGTKHLICTATHLSNISLNLSDNFELGQDIDLANSFSTISGTFSGNFEGRGYTISNSTQPLFSTISTNATDDTRIYDLNLDSFNISQTGTTSASYGVLSNTIMSSGSGNKLEIDNIAITQSSISVTGGTTINLGGLTGNIDFQGTSPVAGEYIYLRRNRVEVDLTHNDSGYIGGLVGKIVNSTVFDTGVNLEHNKVGTVNTAVSITGSTTTLAIGGLIGQAKDLVIRDGNNTNTIITGKEKIGGHIGEGQNIKILNSYAKLDAIPISNTSSTYISGSIGNIINDKYLEMIGVVTDFSFQDSSSTTHSKIGGLLGSANNTVANQDIKILNSKSEVDISADGSFFGGIAGSISTAMDITTTPYETIYGSVAQGSITSSTTSSANNYRGGFIGSASKVKISRSISTLYLEGSKYLGGALGQSTEGVIIDENYISSTLKNSTLTATNLVYLGGLIGHATGSGTAGQYPKLSNNLIDIEVDTVTNCFTDATIFCGAAIGKNAVTSLSYDISGSVISFLVLNDTTYASSSADLTQSSNTSGINPTDIAYTTAAGSCPSSSSYPFTTASGLCTQKFISQWEAYGYTNDANGINYLAGNSIEPFPINTVSDWNGIQSDSFLVSKTFKLTSDIDFQNGVFNPIGTTDYSVNPTEVFTGSIIPNGYKLLNISISSSQSSGITGYGVFPNIQRARIGSHHDPLVIDGFSLTLTPGAASYNAGVIGQVLQGADVSIQVKNGSISATNVNSVGGLIGKASGYLRLESSGFEGSVESDSGNIGGLIGNLFDATSFTTSIRESYVRLTTLKGSSNIGGLIGNTASNNTLEVDNSYVKFLGDSSNLTNEVSIITATGIGGGLVGNLLGTAIIKNGVLDITNSSIDCNGGGNSGCFKPIASFDPTAGSITGTTFIVNNSLTLTGGLAPTNNYTFSDSISMSNHTDFPSKDKDFILDGSNSVRLYWELNGFENY